MFYSFSKNNQEHWGECCKARQGNVVDLNVYTPYDLYVQYFF
jgi:hypothetical protein